MANRLTIKIKDSTKTAVAKETVALCGMYDVAVEPAFRGNGKLVLYRTAPESVARVIPGENTGTSNFDVKNLGWKKNPVYAVFDLTDGLTQDEKPLDLGVKNLIEDYCARYAPETVAPLRFAVYSNEDGGLIGSGELMVKVVEPYRAADDQDFCNWRGDKGEDGLTPEIEIGNVQSVGPDGSASATLRKATDEEGNEIKGKYLLDLSLKQGNVGICSLSVANGTDEEDNQRVIGVTSLEVGTRASQLLGDYAYGTISLNEDDFKVSYATKNASIAGGNNSKTVSKGSIAIGNFCHTWGSYGGFASGHFCTAGAYSNDSDAAAKGDEDNPGLAVGDNCIAVGTGSIAAGKQNYVIGDVGCIAVGWDNTIGKATLDFSNGLNVTAINSGDERTCCGAIGYKNDVQADYSVAFGVNNNAYGYASVAIGELNKANGSHAVAIGNSNEATGEGNDVCSVAIGRGNTASGTDSVAIGAGNKTEVEVWDAEEKGYVTVHADSAVAIGNNNKASGESSFAIGNNNKAAHKNSIVIGTDGGESKGEGTLSLYGEEGVWITSDSSTGGIRLDVPTDSSDKDPVDFIHIGDDTLRHTIKKYAQIVPRDIPTFEFTTLEDGITHRITLKQDGGSDYIDLKDAVLQPYAWESVATDWDYKWKIENLSALADKEYVTCLERKSRVIWMESRYAGIGNDSGPGYYLELALHYEWLHDTVNIDGVTTPIYKNAWWYNRIFVTKDDNSITDFYFGADYSSWYLHEIYKSNLTQEIIDFIGTDDVNETYITGSGIYVSGYVKRSLYAKKGSPYITNEYVDERLALTNTAVDSKIDTVKCEIDTLYSEVRDISDTVTQFHEFESSDTEEFYFNAEDRKANYIEFWCKCGPFKVKIPKSNKDRPRKFSISFSNEIPGDYTDSIISPDGTRETWNDIDDVKEVDALWIGNNSETIVEKFPGASKALLIRKVNGNYRMTWLVEEVAPNVLLVDRVPGKVSITGDNGNNYTLGVDADGVLEVNRDE